MSVVLSAVSAASQTERAREQGAFAWMRPTPKVVLSNLDATFECGIQCIVGLPDEGTHLLGRLIAGELPPARGTVSISGEAPWRSAALRARIGYLGPVPDAPLFRTLGGLFDAAGRDASAALERFGLGPALGLRERPMRSFSLGELRAVELALALSVREPAAVVLVEPFAMPGLVEGEVIGVLSELRCPVIVVTADPSVAQRFDRVLTMGPGGLAATPRGLGLGVEMVVMAGRGGADLCGELAKDPVVRSLSWVAHSASGSTLRVAAESEIALTDAIVRAVAETSCELFSLTRSAPELAELRAARAFSDHVKWSAQAGRGPTIALGQLPWVEQRSARPPTPKGPPPPGPSGGPSNRESASPGAADPSSGSSADAPPDASPDASPDAPREAP